MGRDCKEQKSGKKTGARQKVSQKNGARLMKKRVAKKTGAIKRSQKKKTRMCSGNVGNAFGARQNVLQGNRTRVQGRRGLGKPERDLQRGLGARQE